MNSSLPLLAVLLAFSAGCSAQKPMADTVAASSTAQRAPQHPVTKLQLTGDDGHTIPVEAEVVSKEEDRRQGLMFRDNVPEGTGMLFVFPKEEEHAFWMKNTLVPLDMLFIKADKTVAGIVHNTTPYSEESVTVGVPSLYVLEVPGGFCLKNGVSRGSRVEFALP